MLENKILSRNFSIPASCNYIFRFEIQQHQCPPKQPPRLDIKTCTSGALDSRDCCRKKSSASPCSLQARVWVSQGCVGCHPSWARLRQRCCCARSSIMGRPGAGETVSEDNVQANDSMRFYFLLRPASIPASKHGFCCPFCAAEFPKLHLSRKSQWTALRRERWRRAACGLCTRSETRSSNPHAAFFLSGNPFGDYRASSGLSDVPC